MATSEGTEHEDPDAWKDLDECEGCDIPGEEEPLRAIKMRKGRRRLLCMGCFAQKREDDEVDPTDPREIS